MVNLIMGLIIKQLLCCSDDPVACTECDWSSTGPVLVFEWAVGKCPI